MFFDLNFWQGFLGNLLATIIGVAVGIPVAFWINRRVESNTEKERKFKILEMLSFELGYNLGIIGRWLAAKEKEDWLDFMYGTMLKDQAWSAFSLGGELQWIKDPILLTYIANLYGDLKEARETYVLVVEHGRKDKVLHATLLALANRLNKKIKIVLDMIGKSNSGEILRYENAMEMQNVD